MKDIKPFSSTRLGIPVTALLAILAQLPLQAERKPVASFGSPDSLKAWRSVNDDVMGGVSKGGFKLSDSGNLLFRGELSLKNNGGFASIRTEGPKLDLSDMSALVIKARGDGRTYWVDLRERGQMRASSYRAYLPTKDGEWQETRIPLSDFKYQAFGNAIGSKPIDTASVISFGFTIADKKEGEFSLEIESVAATDEPAKEGEAAPGKGDTIVDVAKAAGNFKTLIAAAGAAGLADTLSGDGPLTVLAPTDEAFAKLPEGTVDNLLKPENRAQLTAVLTNHVFKGSVPLAKALEAGEGTSLQGSKLAIRFADGRVKIGPATLISADIKASNGIIHVIDQVLVPSLPEPAPASPIALIELAISRGVPLFNGGDEAACAAIYEVTCEALRIADGVPERNRKRIAGSLARARAESSPEKQAWILRGALDETWEALQKNEAHKER